MYQIKQLKTALCFVVKQKQEYYISLLNLEELSRFNRRLVNLLIEEFWSIVLINGQSIILVRVFLSLFMLIGLRQKGLTIAAGFVAHRFYGFRGFVGFVLQQVLWFSSGVSQFCGFIGFVVSKVSWLHTFRGFLGFVVSMVSQVLWVRGFMSFVVSWFHRFHGSHLFLFIRTNIFFMLKINTCTCQTQVERTNLYVAQKKKKERKYSP